MADSANNLDPLLSGLSIDETILTWYVDVADTQYAIVSSVGEFVVTSEQLSTHNNTPIPDVFALHQNYPNPFNPTTTLRYDLPADAKVSLVIYDIMGREVIALVNQIQKAGFKSVVWDGNNSSNQQVSAGMYLYRISAGEFHSVKKMLLLK